MTRKYAPFLRKGQLWIDLTGEKEQTMIAASESLGDGVEYIGVHEMFGPNSKDIAGKNVVITSGMKAEKAWEYMNLYSMGWANVVSESIYDHDMYAAAEQKLPQVLAIAMTGALRRNGISPVDMMDHSTLTSRYMHLLIGRLHHQNPYTYAEIQASNTQGSSLIQEAIDELTLLKKMGDRGGGCGSY